jgi:hypothetical protein
MENTKYALLTSIGVAAWVLGLVGLSVGAVELGTVVLAIGALIALSGVLGAIWKW